MPLKIGKVQGFSKNKQKHSKLYKQKWKSKKGQKNAEKAYMQIHLNKFVWKPSAKEAMTVDRKFCAKSVGRNLRKEYIASCATKLNLTQVQIRTTIMRKRKIANPPNGHHLSKTWQILEVLNTSWQVNL